VFLQENEEISVRKRSWITSIRGNFNLSSPHRFPGKSDSYQEEAVLTVRMNLMMIEQKDIQHLK